MCKKKKKKVVVAKFITPHRDDDLKYADIFYYDLLRIEDLNNFFFYHNAFLFKYIISKKKVKIKYRVLLRYNKYIDYKTLYIT